MKECNPDDFVRHVEMDERCKGNMRWAETIISESSKDRENLWTEVNELKKIPGRLQTWFIILLCAGIIVPFISSKLTKNGEAEALKRQFEVSKTNDTNIQTIMLHLNLPYKAPQIYKPGE